MSKSKTKQAKVAVTRLVNDRDVQKQVRVATGHVRDAWRRVSGRPVSKAVSDKKLYSSVRDAATSVAAVGRTLGRKPEPKRTGRKLVAAAALAGGAIFAVKKKKRQSRGPDFTPVSAEPTGPVAAPTPPTPVTTS